VNELQQLLGGCLIHQCLSYVDSGHQTRWSKLTEVQGLPKRVRDHDGEAAPCMAGCSRTSLRLVVVSGLTIELELIAEFYLGDERKHHGDGEPKLTLVGQLRDLPVEGKGGGRFSGRRLRAFSSEVPP
jgi:hypothetical protein